MQNSSETSADPWRETTTVSGSTGTRWGRSEHALGGSTTTSATTSSGADVGGGASNGGPLVTSIERSAWTKEDVELLLDVLQILALLAAAYAAYQGTQ